MEEWAGLDVDDSDLLSLIRPSSSLIPSKRAIPNDHHTHVQEPKRTASVPSASPPDTILLSSPSLHPCSQILPLQTPQQNPFTAPHPLSPHLLDDGKDSSRRRIPGPAGSVQAAMHRETFRGENCSPVSSCNQEDNEDEDFKLNPWLCALDFLGLDVAKPLPYSIGMSQTMERIPQVLGVIKSCQPNGLGDLIVTMKDPTGTISASIHRKVLSESEFASAISVDSVVILQQVVAFSPRRSLRYLNITVNNLVKVFSKDSRPPNHHFPCSSAAPRSCGQETRSGTSAAPITRQETNEIINVVAKRVETDTGSGSGRVSEGIISKVSKRVEKDIGTGNGRVSERIINMVAKGVGTDVGTGNGRVSEGSLGGNSCKASVVEEPDQETCGRGKKPTSRALLPDWTDEQLEELFAYCGDDIIRPASKISI